MNEAAGTVERSSLRPGHYRHPAELPTLVAALGLAVTAVLAVQLVLVLAVVVLGGPTRQASVYAGVAGLVWFNGGLIAALSRQAQHLRAMRRSAVDPGPALVEAVNQAAATLGLGRPPTMWLLSSGGYEATALGWRAPQLFVDAQLLAQLRDPLQLRAIIARELAHIACGHVALRTWCGLPAPVQPLHPALELPLALVRWGLRWWWSLAEQSADRAAAVAVAGPEPLGYALSRLAAARAQRGAVAEEQLRRYCDDLFSGRPVPVPRLIYQHGLLDVGRLQALARFTNSVRFGRCLALAGHLRHEPREAADDPERVSLLPYAVIWLLAALYLSVPVALLTRAGVFSPPAGPPAPTVAARTSAPFNPEVQVPNRPQLPAPEVASDINLQSGLLELARKHKERGEYDKARRALEDLIRANPLHAEAHYLLAWVCVALGDRRAALAEFTATVNLTDPDSALHVEAQAALQRMSQ